MGRDESGTLARLRKNRSEHFDPVLTKYGGRLVKLTGDEVEIARVQRRQDGNLVAYDCYLRALALTNSFTREAAEGMLRHSLQAITLDPLFAPPYALAARAYIQRITQGWIVDFPTESAEALDLVERGLRADRRDPMMLGTAGHCYAWFGHDLVKAAAYIDEAIDINPELRSCIPAKWNSSNAFGRL